MTNVIILGGDSFSYILTALLQKQGFKSSLFCGPSPILDKQGFRYLENRFAHLIGSKSSKESIHSNDSNIHKSFANQQDLEFKVFNDIVLKNWFDNGNEVSLRFVNDLHEYIDVKCNWLIVTNPWFNAQKKLNLQYHQNKYGQLELEERRIGRLLFSGQAFQPLKMIPSDKELQLLSNMILSEFQLSNPNPM